MAWIRERNIQAANIIKVMSINPTAMQAVLDLNSAITFGGSTLTRVQEEAITTSVSVVNQAVSERWLTGSCSVSNTETPRLRAGSCTTTGKQTWTPRPEGYWTSRSS